MKYSKFKRPQEFARRETNEINGSAVKFHKFPAVSIRMFSVLVETAEEKLRKPLTYAARSITRRRQSKPGADRPGAVRPTRFLERTPVIYRCRWRRARMLRQVEHSRCRRTPFRSTQLAVTEQLLTSLNSLFSPRRSERSVQSRRRHGLHDGRTTDDAPATRRSRFPQSVRALSRRILRTPSVR